MNVSLLSFKPKALHRYILSQFLVTLCLCMFAAVSLFLLFDFLEHLSLFIKEGSSFGLVLRYFFYKIPLILHLTTPIALLIAVLFTVGRLSQNSEITAMRACGASLFWIVRPLLVFGVILSALMFIAGETVVPWATNRVEDIYHLEIKRKAERGTLSRDNIWYRSEGIFYNVGFYDSRGARLEDISLFELDKDFRLRRRIDAREGVWQGTSLGWLMHDVDEVTTEKSGEVHTSHFDLLPLVIKEKPEDFFSMRRSSETMGYFELSRYIEKLQAEGVRVSSYVVERDAKLSFSLVSFILVILAFPFSLRHARQGSFTRSFIAGVCIGFGYYILHAFFLSFGSAELLSPILAAWTTNILSLCLGGYLLIQAEVR